MYANRARQGLVVPILAAVLGGCVAVGSASVPPANDSAGPSADNAAGSQPPSSGAVIGGPPVTLRLAIADNTGRPSQVVVDDFIQQVALLSGGKMTVVPTYDASPDFESGVVELVQHGDTDLALAASRAWDLHDEHALQAFQAPFLVDNDALLRAVMTSPVPREALDAMTTAVGLSMWPEDLRHLTAFTSCRADYRSPEGVAGETILVQPSAVSRAIATALGAHPYDGSDRDADASSCALQGIEAGMGNVQAVPMGAAPSLVGNITLFPKLQVLAASRGAFDALSAEQQSVVRQAAEAVAREALGTRSSDAVLAQAWCDAGGAIALARPGAQEAFRAAVEPVYAELLADQKTSALINEISALKETTTRSPGAEPCAASARATFVPADAVDKTGYQATIPPDGTYRRVLVADELIAAGLAPDLAHGNEQTLTMTFDHGQVTFTWDEKNNDNSGSCTGMMRVVDGSYLATTSDNDQFCGTLNHAMWKQEPDGISFVHFDPEMLPSDHILLDYWVWTRIK
jgi:TRAP-type C4-dicarboxylate transport system substrate-binding protein